MALGALGQELMQSEVERGSIKKGWGMSGFSGFKAGECEVGFRGEECMVRLMSDLAKNCWRSIYQTADHVTRIDLQYTLDHKSVAQPLIYKYYKQANRMSARRANGPKNNIVLGNDGGATLYCGTRWSNVFGRIYAKGPQSKDPLFETCIRYEVQYQRKLARLVARKVAGSQDPAVVAIASSDTFFGKRIQNFPKRTSSVINYCCSRKRSNLQQRLIWFSTNVKPSVQLLVSRGLLQETVDALGLSEYVCLK